MNEEVTIEITLYDDHRRNILLQLPLDWKVSKETKEKKEIQRSEPKNKGTADHNDYRLSYELISPDNQSSQSFHVFPSPSESSNIFSFVPTQIGEYRLSVLSCGQHIRSSPLYILVGSSSLSSSPSPIIPSSLTDLTGSVVKIINNIHPISVIFYKEHLFLTDVQYNEVLMIDCKWNIVRRLGRNILTYPYGISIATISETAYNIFVTDTISHCVFVLDQNGNFLGKYGSKGDRNGEFTYPHGILERDGLLYVADCLNHRIQILNASNGSFIKMFGGEIKYPYFLSTNDHHELFITSNHRIDVFSMTGVYLRTLESLMGNINTPCGITVTSSRDTSVVVCDNGNHRILILDKEGKTLRTFGSLGGGSNQFRYPIDIEYFKGMLAICDTSNKRLIVVK
jgi:hypothetical protein